MCAVGRLVLISFRDVLSLLSSVLLSLSRNIIISLDAWCPVGVPDAHKAHRFFCAWDGSVFRDSDRGVVPLCPHIHTRENSS